MNNQNEVISVHYKEGALDSESKKTIFTIKKLQLVVNFMYNVKCHGFSRQFFIH